MKAFALTISTPDGNCFSGECAKLDVRGVEGSLGILAGHIPFVTALKAGECNILLPDGTYLDGEVDGGILTVDTDCVTLIAGSFHFLDDYDPKK